MSILTSVPMPRAIRFSLIFVVAFVVAGILVRGVFHAAFAEGASHLEAPLIAKAYLLGARYDLRLALLILLPVLILSVSRRTTPFLPGRRRQRAWGLYFGVVAALLVLFHIFDFAHFAYLGTKLAASILNFLEDPKESAGMVWQTYPVLRLLLL